MVESTASTARGVFQFSGKAATTVETIQSPAPVDTTKWAADKMHMIMIKTPQFIRDTIDLKSRVEQPGTESSTTAQMAIMAVFR